MAMITCVECGKSISSFAASCPNCGCPSEMQKSSENLLPRVVTNLNSLKRQTEWAVTYGHIQRKEIDAAIRKIIQFSGATFFEAQRIVDQMIICKGIPIEYIISILPDEAQCSATKPCSACSRPISIKAETCPHCGQPTGVHVCPRCGSTNTYVISRVDKVAMTFVFGRYAAHNVMSKYGCEDCKYTF